MKTENIDYFTSKQTRERERDITNVTNDDVFRSVQRLLETDIRRLGGYDSQPMRKSNISTFFMSGRRVRKSYECWIIFCVIYIYVGHRYLRIFVEAFVSVKYYFWELYVKIFE
jgi:hypothetical protein